VSLLADDTGEASPLDDDLGGADDGGGHIDYVALQKVECGQGRPRMQSSRRIPPSHRCTPRSRTSPPPPPADGSLQAEVPGHDGAELTIQGWFKESPDGTREITSHAPRYEKDWPTLPTEEW
jgi:hypothetical protein